MLQGLMQDDAPLTLQYLLKRMRTVHRDAEVIYPPEQRRLTFGEVADRADRLAAALSRLGVGDGDRVGVLMWNRPEYFEAYYAIPAMGAVLHPLNQRLFATQLEYTIDHAQDRVIVVEDVLVPVLEALADRLPSVRHYVVVGPGGPGSLAPASRYEDLLAAEDGGFDYPEILDDRQASTLTFTSGTTGNPKGVQFSHRANVLQALALCAADTFGIRSGDRVLQTSPLFHALGWCMPYTSGMAGATVIFPGRKVDAKSICDLIEQERVTWTGAVPTVLTDLLAYADEHHPDFSSLRFMLSGASALPESIMRGLEERHGVVVTGSWGMTEAGPVGGVARAPAQLDPDAAWPYRQKSARLFPLIDYRIMDADGTELPWDGVAAGELELRGPYVASGYLDDPVTEGRFRDGWLRTGDIVSIDDRGYLQVIDRIKDVIKSGGEWISSVDLENELMGHAGIREAAVIAIPHPRWKERPLACVVPLPGVTIDPAEVRTFLSTRVSRLWLPESFAFVAEVPKTSTGKLDKKTLRAQYAAGELDVVSVEKATTVTDGGR